jgi:predicted nucleic acid-binding protein
MNGWNNPGSNLTPQERNTVESFKRIENDVIYMCEASVGELIYGVERSQKKEYGQTKAALSKVGIIIPDIDLLIAATAKYHDMVLVANDKHMKNLPDSFVRENWARV